MANTQLTVSTQAFNDFRQRLTAPELLMLLAATRLALADAQMFDWIVEEHGIDSNILDDLRTRVNNTFWTPTAISVG